MNCGTVSLNMGHLPHFKPVVLLTVDCCWSVEFEVCDLCFART